MKEPVMLRKQDLAAIAQELKSQGLQPRADADRTLARIANGALAHRGITSERTHGRDYDRDFGPSRERRPSGEDGRSKKTAAQNIDTEEEAEAGAAAVRRREEESFIGSALHY